MIKIIKIIQTLIRFIVIVIILFFLSNAYADKTLKNQALKNQVGMPGSHLPIKKIDLKIEGDGKDNPIIQEAIKKFPLEINQPFLITEYNTAKNNLFETVTHQGYLKAIWIKKEILIDLKKNSANITLYLNTGERYYFGQVSFSKSPFAPRFLERFIPFKQNKDPFSSQKILQLQQDLSNSHYFGDVAITPKLNQIKNKKIPVHIGLSVPKEKQYRWGIGYGTLTGPRVLFGVDWRRIGDSGQHMTAIARLSPVLKGLAAKYFIAGKNPLTDQYTLGATIQEFKPQNGSSFSESLNMGYVTQQQAFEHTLSFNLLNERYVINNQPRHNSHELYPSYHISHVVTDNIVDPHAGHMVYVTLQGASESIASTTSFIQGEIKAKYILSPMAFNRIILRGDLGYTVVNDLNQLPLTLQYLAGGSGSVRGYNYGSIGPGRYLETASAEYQNHITGNWYVAAFYDIGTATNQFNKGFKRSNGVGVIYTSPIGSIQLYIARAESKSWKPKSIVFNIGPEF